MVLEISKATMVLLIKLIQWAFTPNPNINYNVISTMYGVASALCIGFYLLETYLVSTITTAAASAAQNVNDSEVTTSNDGAGGEGVSQSSADFAAELYSSLQGVHLIFVPFMPCLIWSMTIQYHASQKSQSPSSAVAKPKTE
jgi:hypothetical protein